MKHFLKKILCWTLISNCFLMTAYAAPAWPAGPDIQAEAGAVIDMDSGAILGGKAYDTPYPPASITKLLTALLVLEHSKLDEMVTFSNSAVYNVESDSGNKLNVAEGDQLSVEDCLYSLLVHSCNQAANALAEHVAGSQEAFVKMMNDKAAALGCKDSHFDNPSGLNGDTQYVTARDMAAISRAAFAEPDIIRISAALKHTFPPTINNPEGLTIYAENKLILNTNDSSSQYYYPPVKGGKTGYLLKAGNTLVTYAEKDGKRLISVILKGSPGQYYLDGKALLEFGFEHFTNYNVAENESAYTEGEAAVDVGAKSYLPADLEIDPAGAVTLPEGAAFTDLEHTLVTDYPDEHPERSVAFIQYTYDGRKAGGAYLTQKEVQEPVTEPESQEETQPETDDKKEDGKKGFSINPFLIIALVVIAAAAGGGAYIFYSRKKEEQRRALRREQRRRRLREEGVTEEEFDRLLKERLGDRSKGKNQKKK